MFGSPMSMHIKDMFKSNPIKILLPQRKPQHLFLAMP